jgi:hypothetical protein
MRNPIFVSIRDLESKWNAPMHCLLDLCNIHERIVAFSCCFVNTSAFSLTTQPDQGGR